MNPASTAQAATLWPLLLPWLPVVAVTLGLGIPTLLIAREQKRIAAEQKRVAQAKLKLDLFDRRMTVFQSAWRLLSLSLQMRPDAEYHAELQAKRVELQSQLPEALFLFGSDVFEYLKTILQKTLLQGMRAAQARRNGALPPELIEEELAYAQWVGTEAGTGVRDRFAPFLDFSQWQ